MFRTQEIQDIAKKFLILCEMFYSLFQYDMEDDKHSGVELFEIWGSHCSEYQDNGLLGYDAL
jgi:hypothetical protein